MSNTELKPCPFCGCSKVFYVAPYPEERYYPIAQCMRCYAQVSGTDHDESMISAIDNWNTRTTRPSDAIEQVIRDCDDFLTANSCQYFNSPAEADRASRFLTACLSTLQPKENSSES